MNHGLGRGARSLIALGVILAHGLLLLLPLSFTRAVWLAQEMQVRLVAAPPAQNAPQAEPEPEKKPRSAPPPKSQAVVKAAPAPVALERKTLETPVPPVSSTSISTSSASASPVAAPGQLSAPLAPVAPAHEVLSNANTGNTRTAAATANPAQPRKAAWCDTRLRESDYPISARKDEQEGRVLIQTRVLASGKTQDAKVIKTSGFALLDQAALRASTQWPCTPARLDGVAMDSWIAVPVVFRID